VIAIEDPPAFCGFLDRHSVNESSSIPIEEKTDQRPRAEPGEKKRGSGGVGENVS